MAWSDVVGQPQAIQILRAHLANQRVSPGYLFVGPEGVGKRLTALELAKALNCKQAGPCDECESCRRIRRGVHPDLHTLGPDGPSAAIRIDEVRRILDRIALRPYLGAFSVVIVDGADRLTEEAANALLKALEEPPGETRFILVSAQASRCLSTIVSRCQTIRFQRLAPSLIEGFLIRHHSCDAGVARSAGRLALGSLSLAIELASRWAAYNEMLKQLASRDAFGWVGWVAPSDRQGLKQWLACAIAWLRDVAVLGVTDESLIGHSDFAAAIRQQAKRLDSDRCMECAMRFIELCDSLEQAANPRLVGALMREQWLDLLRGVSHQR